MGSKNACALEFACILGRNIKCSVIIIIIIKRTTTLKISTPGGLLQSAKTLRLKKYPKIRLEAQFSTSLKKKIVEPIEKSEPLKRLELTMCRFTGNRSTTKLYPLTRNQA